jgi:hypothetical protein
LKAESCGSEPEGSGLEAGRSGAEAGGSRLEAEGTFPGLPSGRRVFRFLVRAGGSDFRQNCTSQPILEINWVTLEVDFEIPEVQGGVALDPRRSREVRGSPELKNGGLRAPEDAWMTTS